MPKRRASADINRPLSVTVTATGAPASGGGGGTLPGTITPTTENTVSGDRHVHRMQPTHASLPDIGAEDHHDLVTAGNTGIGVSGQAVSVALAATSGLQVSSGLMLADTIAGDGLAIASKVLSVGVSGLGLGVTANAVTLTSSSNPGAAASILASDATGALQLVNLTLTGDLTTSRVAGHLIPKLVDTYDLGSSTLLWRKGWLSELDTILFAKNTITLLGGWFYVTPNAGTWPVDLAASAANVNVDFGQAMTVNDFLVSRGSLAVEYFKITALVSGTTYTVQRNLDGSGANAWPAGTPFAVLGQSGSGRIELNAYDTPRIQILTQGATYNAQTEIIRLGDLNGNWGYASAAMGLAVGQYAAGKANMVYDPTNGLRLRVHSADKIVLDNAGNSYFAGVMTLGASGEIRQGTGTLGVDYTGLRLWRDTNVGRIGGYNDDVLQWYGATDGKLYAGGGKTWLDATGVNLNLAAGSPFSYTAGTAIRWRSGAYAPGILTTEINSVTGETYLQLLCGNAASYAQIYLRGHPTSTILTRVVVNAGQIDLNTNTYVSGGLNVGSATGAGAGQVLATSASDPVALFDRLVTATTNVHSAAGIKVTTTDNMADGFGPALVFRIEDSAGVSNLIGSIGAVRAGADNTGAVVIRTALAGSNSESGRFTANNNLLLGATTDYGARLRAHGDVFVTSQTTPTAGSGVDLAYASSIGYVQAYDFSGSAWKIIKLRGLTAIVLSDSTSAPADGDMNAKEIAFYVDASGNLKAKWKNPAGTSKTVTLSSW